VKRSLIVCMIFLGLSTLATGSASAQPGERLATSPTCAMNPTVQSLRECVLHARAIGAIDSAGVTTSLLAKLDVAQSALNSDHPRIAVGLLRAFLREVEAQAGKHIAQPHANDLEAHARLVIQALRGPEEEQLAE
jgi:hypothetical protein